MPSLRKYFACHQGTSVYSLSCLAVQGLSNLTSLCCVTAAPSCDCANLRLQVWASSAGQHVSRASHSPGRRRLRAQEGGGGPYQAAVKAAKRAAKARDAGTTEEVGTASLAHPVIRDSAVEPLQSQTAAALAVSVQFSD